MFNLIFRDVGSGSPLLRPSKSSALGAGIISGAGSLIGGLFSSHGSRDAARYQLQAARETNQTNRDIAEQNNKFNERMWKNFKIERNKFKDVGALCADFSTATMDCEFVDNYIDNAAGIAKTQNHYSFNSGNIPLRNKINLS